ncbi:hypothetical protein RclHR1_09390001 [Rhizophagus clarus]|uniref:Crinkler effector protein N-terminal domain-containing protein n=1 Tax=Rhizophagus clarus TaxID=94130 RepID=A0A2Z6SEK1_9GLOM|nr:hypothetical protein RclHR1_09390001 [Rhizophagus clarus]
MSITLFCLVKENTTVSAFKVDIEKDKSISKLKEAIKAKNPQTFVNVDAKDLKLWKVPISDDHVNPLSNLSLEDSDELLVIKKISKYFPDSPPEEHIHVIVSPPEATATSEVLKLREEVASLKEKLSKSEYEFDIIVKPKQKANKWTVNIEQGTLSNLKDYICELYKPPALENDGAVLNFMNNEGKYYSRNDVAFWEMLRSLVSKNNLKFTVFIETPSKPFNK